MIFKEQNSSLPSLILGELWLYVFVEYTDPDTAGVFKHGHWLCSGVSHA